VIVGDTTDSVDSAISAFSLLGGGFKGRGGGGGKKRDRQCGRELM
jgi:hypothetical protein